MTKGIKLALFLVFLLLTIILIFGCQNKNSIVQKNAVKVEDKAVESEKNEFPGSQMVAYGNNYHDYLVKPTTPGKFPAVVMMHEWWGLNQNIKDMANDLAKEGYVVLAVDLYDGKVATTPEDAGKYAAEVSQNADKAISHMKSAVSYLKKQDYMIKDSIASMGWCFGGGMSLQLSLNQELNATVIYYGSLETDKSKLSKINWPVLGIFGEKDTVINPETVKKFQTELNQLNITNEIYIYDGVGHAFANPSNPRHDPQKTKDAWEKTVSFLNRNLKKQ